MATKYYPIFLDLARRPCVVIGAGRIATPKIRGLLEAEASVTVVAPIVDAQVEAWDAQGRIRLLRRAYRDGDLENAFLVIAGTNDVAVNRAVHDEARMRGCLINVVDTKPLCEFIVPALVRRGDLTIAIGTNGIAPTLASQLRQSIEHMLDDGCAQFLDQAKIWRRRISRLGIGYDAKKSLWSELIADVSANRHNQVESRHAIDRTINRHVPPADLEQTGTSHAPFHVFGIDHAHAPLSLLEQVAGDVGLGERLARRLLNGNGSDGTKLCHGAVVLSTCQRIEVYFDSDCPARARDLLFKALTISNRISFDDLGKFAYLHSGISAVHHLFNVAVGLESIVMFENDVQGQVRSAMNRAESWGTLSPGLATTFQRALALGKKVRRSMGETPRRSLAHCAVEFALARTAGATGTRVILLGEGPFAEVVERALTEHGVACDRRTLEAFLSELSGNHADADRELIIFSCLRTISPVLTNAVFSSRSRTSTCRTSIMDLGMPRNVSTDVGDLLNCQVWDLDDLGAIPPEAPLEAIVEARMLVAMEVARYARREAHEKSRIGEVILVGAGPGDPNLLTIGGKAAIADATVIVHDRLVSPKVLEFASTGCRLFAAGKEGHGEQAKQDDINQLMVALAREGERVVRLKGGDPFVFGRGAEELQFLASRGIACRVIPGVSSVGAVPASVGIPLTHRLLAHSYSVVSAHDCTDPARPLKRIAALARVTDTLVILMGMSRIGEIVRALRDAGVPAERLAAAIESGTTPHERSIVAPLDKLVQAVADAALKTPGLIVVGDVVGLGNAPKRPDAHPTTISGVLVHTLPELSSQEQFKLRPVSPASLPARNHAALPRREGRAARARG